MNVKVTQKLPLSITISDAKGNAAQVDGVPAWSLTDPALGDLTVAADGMSAELAPKGPTGSCQVQVSADADLGAGVVSILGGLDVDFLPGDAVSISIAAGTPVDA